MPRIAFEADTETELLDLAWRWVMGPSRGADSSPGDSADQADLRRRQMGEVLNAIRGPDSRRLLREADSPFGIRPEDGEQHELRGDELDPVEALVAVGPLERLSGDPGQLDVGQLEVGRDDALPQRPRRRRPEAGERQQDDAPDGPTTIGQVSSGASRSTPGRHAGSGSGWSSGSGSAGGLSPGLAYG